MKILLIEDNPGDARLIQEVLKEAGSDFTISVAEKLGLGLEFLLSQEVDVVLLDLGLPDSRGLETLTKVRTKFSHLPIVIMTSSADEALAVQAVHLGAQDYLVKGQVESGLLRRALLYAIERKKADEALHREKTISDTTIESLPGVFYLFDSQGRFLKWNKNFERVSGYTAEELARMQPPDFFLGEDKRLIEERVQEVFTKGESSAEAEFVSKDGHKTPYFFTGVMTNIGNTKCLVGMGMDITERRKFEEALQEANAALEERVSERTAELAKANELLEEDIAERKRTEEQLKESEKKLRYLSTELMTAQEKERKRIAGELHDSIAASLSAIKLGIENIFSQMGQDERCQSLRDVISRVQQVNEETRRIMSDLRPSMLDDLGIVPAINWFCREFQKTYSSVSIQKKIDIEENDVPDSLRTPIFRICQEALNNVAKHSKATLVNLSLQKFDKRIELSIEDNGKGFNSGEKTPEEHSRKGLGLVSMRERAELSGGFFNIESTRGKGTVICAWWPLR